MIRSIIISLGILALATHYCFAQGAQGNGRFPAASDAQTSATGKTRSPAKANRVSPHGRKIEPRRVALTEREKIDYLLKQVEDSGLIFIRNGSEYPSKKAAEHLRGKLDYAGDRIKTARQFIDILASKSSRSGKPYYIKQKDGTLVPSGQWLTRALEELEKRQNRTAMPTPTPRPSSPKPK